MDMCDGMMGGVSRCRKQTGFTRRFPKIRGAFLRVPIARTTVFEGGYWGLLILGKYHIKKLQNT